MFFIGDVHGTIPRYLDIITEMLPPNAQSLQVGDMGLFTDEKAKQLPVMPSHKFFRGNHDSPQLCQSHPNYLGDYGYMKKQEMFWMAGGYSIDHARRLEGVSKWHDEELGWNVLQTVIEMYADTKPKIVVSHECPSVIKAIQLANAYSHLPPGVMDPKAHYVSRTENALQTMFEAHKPDVWVFGHYHFLLDTIEEGTRFIGLGDHRRRKEEQVFELPDVSW